MQHLTHWGRVTHICVGNLTIIVSENGLSPGRHQAIIWTNAGILFIGPIGTNFSEILIRIQTFSFKKMHLKMSSAKWRRFCLCHNVLKGYQIEVKTKWLAFCQWHFQRYFIKRKFFYLNYNFTELFFPRGPNDNNSVMWMGWQQPGNKPLHRPMLTHLPLVLHICISELGHHWFR